MAAVSWGIDKDVLVKALRKQADDIESGAYELRAVTTSERVIESNKTFTVKGYEYKIEGIYLA